MVDTTAEGGQETTGAVEERPAAQLVARARSEGLSPVGEGGLLEKLARTVLEGALEGETSGRLGCESGGPAGRNGG